MIITENRATNVNAIGRASIPALLKNRDELTDFTTKIKEIVKKIYKNINKVRLPSPFRIS